MRMFLYMLPPLQCCCNLPRPVVYQRVFSILAFHEELQASTNTRVQIQINEDYVNFQVQNSDQCGLGGNYHQTEDGACYRI